MRRARILLRAIDNARNPETLPVDVDAAMQEEAVTALRDTNGLIELFTLFDDVAIGWRGFEVNGRGLRAVSKSAERLSRGIALGVRSEAELNAPFLAASAAAVDSKLLHQLLFLLARVLPRGPGPEPNDALLKLAEQGTRRAGHMLSDWDIPEDWEVAGLFRVREYRRATEVVKAFAGTIQIFDDYSTPRDPPRLPVKTKAEWAHLFARRAGVDDARANAILDFMTHAASDMTEAGRSSPPTAHTSFLDLGDGRLALSPTLAIWQDPGLALRSIWKTRRPGDYGTKVAALNHRLSDAATALYSAKGWPAVTRRPVPGAGDIDTGTGRDTFFIAGECKVFIDDPVRGADDVAV